MASQAQQAEAVATWAEQQAPATDKPDYSRLADVDRAFILRLRDQGRTQVEIAQQIGCAQSTVNAVLKAFADTSVEAKRFLRGSALQMARNVVEKGQARDHVKTLEGLGVLQAQDSTGLTLVINGLTLHGTGRAAAIEGEVLSPPQLPGASEGESIP